MWLFKEMSEYLKPAAAIALPFLGGAAGSVISRTNISQWYEVSYMSNQVCGLCYNHLIIGRCE